MFHKLFIVVKKVPYITKKDWLHGITPIMLVTIMQKDSSVIMIISDANSLKINKREETRQSNSIQPNVMEPPGRNGLHLGRVKHL